MSVPNTHASGNSAASAIAIAPLPVPISAMRPAVVPAGAQRGHRGFDEMLRFRARNEHALIDGERAAVKAGRADDIRHRRPGETAPDGLRERAFLGRRQHAGAVADEALARRTGDVFEQQRGVKPAGSTHGVEAPAGFPQRLGDGHAADVSPASSRARSSVCSSVTRRSMSPSRIALMF